MSVTFVLPFWGSKPARQPVELEISFGPPPRDVLLPQKQGASKRTYVQVKIKPRGWPPDVAAFHCAIHWDGGHCWVENLGGKEQSLFVIGKHRSNRTVLVTGDILVVAATGIVVAENDACAADLLSDLPAAKREPPEPGAGMYFH